MPPEICTQLGILRAREKFGSERLRFEKMIQVRERQAEFGEERQGVLEHGRATQGELLAGGQEFAQRFEPARHEKISLRIRPAGEDVVWAHRLTRREVYDDNAVEKLLPSGALEVVEPTP